MEETEPIYKDGRFGKRGGGDSNFRLLKRIESEHLPKIIHYLRELDQQQIEILTRLESDKNGRRKKDY